MWNGCDMCGYDLRFCQEEVRNGRAYEAFIVPPTYGKFFRRKMVINPIFFQTDPGCEMPIGEAKRRMYHLVMTNSSPWKDPPSFKFGKASISIRAIYFPWQTVNVITRLGNHNIKDGFRAIQWRISPKSLVSGVSAQPESEFLDRIFWIVRWGTGGLKEWECCGSERLKAT